jgi:hypothetical protein
VVQLGPLTYKPPQDAFLPGLLGAIGLLGIVTGVWVRRRRVASRRP